MHPRRALVAALVVVVVGGAGAARALWFGADDEAMVDHGSAIMFTLGTGVASAR